MLFWAPAISIHTDATWCRNRAEQLWVSSGVQFDEAWKSKRWQNMLQTSVVCTRVCGGQKLIILKCRARGWVSWSAWDLNIFPRIRIADVAYRDHLFLSSQRHTKGTARQARQVMLCALASVKADCIFLYGKDIKLRNAIPEVTFQMTLCDCQKKKKSIAPCLRKCSSYKQCGPPVYKENLTTS